jgi:hypothetical protein
LVVRLKVGLHLLYNMIQGKKELHFGKSIHIKYSAFARDVTASMKKQIQISEEQKKAAKRHA